MSNENNVSLSQSEVDRLLGIDTKEEEKRPKKVFERRKIATEEEIGKFGELMKRFSTILKAHLKTVFSEQGVRKITPASIEQMSREEFMYEAGENEFLFLVEIKSHEFLLKFDSFLFCALAGISFNISHRTNLFQNEAIRTVVAPIVVEDLLKAARKWEKISNVHINPLYDLPALEGLKTKTAGISAAFTWNEGFKSLGIEKIFFQKEFLDFLLTE